MNLKLAIAAFAALSAVCAFAQEEEEQEAEKAPAQAEGQEKAKAKAKDDARVYFTLPMCRRVQGSGEVLKPGSKTWETIEEGRFYPLGTSFRAADASSVCVAFGKECLATVENGSSFGTQVQKLGVESRTLILAKGETKVSLPGNLKPGLFFVKTPCFTIRNPAGESLYTYTDKGDGIDATVKCVTGSIEVEGRHFVIPAMHAADSFRIRSTHDELETVLYGKAGDYVCRLDRGIITRDEIQDDGTVKPHSEQSWLDWHLSVSTRVQINRAVPALGKSLSVTMMTFDSIGALKNHFAFAEGRKEVNTGELVVRKGASEDVAKRAAEVTTEAAAVEESSAEEEEADDNGGDDEEEDEEE